MGHLRSREVGAVSTACCLTFLAARSLSLCSFLCCSQYAAPVLIVCLHPGLLLACTSQSSVLNSTLFQVVFQIILETFSLTTLVSLPIAQFSIKDILGKPGRGHTYNMTSPTKLVAGWSCVTKGNIRLLPSGFLSASFLFFNCASDTVL